MSYSYRRSNPYISLSYFRYSFENDIQLPILPHGPLGFDLEWRPNFKKGGKKNPVALVQIANAQFVFLVQISAMARTFSLHLHSQYPPFTLIFSRIPAVPSLYPRKSLLY